MQRWRSGKQFVLRYDERCAFSHSSLQFNISYAEMAEWSNAHDSKSCYGQLYGGSNPSLCAKNGEVGQKQIARLPPFLYLINTFILTLIMRVRFFVIVDAVNDQLIKGNINSVFIEHQFKLFVQFPSYSVNIVFKTLTSKLQRYA